MDIVCFLSVPSVVCNLIVLQGLQFEIAQFRGPLRENTLGSAYLDACEWPLTCMQSFFCAAAAPTPGHLRFTAHLSTKLIKLIGTATMLNGSTSGQ